MRRIVLPSVACLTVPYFSTLSHKWQAFRKKKTLLNTKCVFWFPLQILPEIFFILRRILGNFITNVRYIGLHVNYPLFLSDFKEIRIFSIDFRKSSNIKFHEAASSGSRVVPRGLTEGQADRQTDMTKLIISLRNFSSAPEYIEWAGFS